MRRYGYIPDLGDKKDQLMVSAPRILSDKIDLRDKMPLPSFDQGDLGSCTANATVGAIVFDQAAQQLPVVMMSRLYLYYYSRVIEHTVSEDAGAQLRDVMKAYNKFGICPETEWPYDQTKFQSKPTSQDCTDAATHRPLIYKRVPQSISNVLRVLASGFPIIFGFTVYENFESQEVADTGILPMPDYAKESSLGGHAVLAMGYDRTTRQILVRNSWGTSWGQDGHFWMPFEYIFDQDLATDFWCIQQIQG